MTTVTTSQYAIVEPGSTAQRGLLALGWTTTDKQGDWDHMEPSSGDAPKVLVVSGAAETSHATSVKMKPGDALIVTADLPSEQEQWMLTEQIDEMLCGGCSFIVKPYEIKVTVLDRSHA